MTRMSVPTDRPDGTASASGPNGRRRGRANVILVGLSGSGKTTVGRLLARRLGWRFVDTDQEIRYRTGQTVEAIFRNQGEPAFRALESEILREVCGRHRQVIATGGGAPVSDANRACMLDGNVVVWLDSSTETLTERLQNSIRREPRPLLAGRDLSTRLDQLGRERAEYYGCAHHTIRTDRKTPREVADVLADLIRAR
jgi:shikimate kinase